MRTLALLQITRVKPFSKPTVDWSEKLASLLPLALLTPEPRQAHWVPTSGRHLVLGHAEAPPTTAHKQVASERRLGGLEV